MAGSDILGDGWSVARLIPTAGIKGPREQEERATSALLSVMRAVPEFGREILGELGAPKGKRTKIDTYLEVPFEDASGNTVRPDGVIVADSGHRRWVALVEVKTGTNQTNPEQVVKYLDVAIANGFDGVLIIDNNILGGAQDVPVEVSKQKLRRASLWQLSWWRIVTEAVLQHDYRGVSDPDQAWILSELIAYLTHDKSGVAELSDMGASWIKVRDGARNNALNRRQPEVDEIARRWEQFVHWVSLGLTQQTGADVTPARIRTPLAERIESTIRELVEQGTLTMRLTIPDTVAPLELVADLRAQLVTASVSINAPGEGRADTRVRWILRQLKNAPDDLRIETRFVSTGKTTATLLSDIRDTDKKALLVDDPQREPRSFHLSLSRPMGMKRGDGPGSFVNETRRQAIDFYRDLLQGLTEWRPKAPPLRERDDVTRPTDTSAGAGSSSNALSQPTDPSTTTEDTTTRPADSEDRWTAQQ